MNMKLNLYYGQEFLLDEEEKILAIRKIKIEREGD